MSPSRPGRIQVLLPRLSEAMQEGALLSWRVRPGDLVQVGQVLAEIETDKATFDLVAPHAGLVEELRLQPGDKAAVGEVVCVLTAPGALGEPPRPGRIAPEAATFVEPSAAPAAALVQVPGPAPLPDARAATAPRGSEGAAVPPHHSTWVTISVDVEPMLELRGRWERAPGKPLQLGDFVARACAVALRRHPHVNACFLGDGRGVVLHPRVHLGVVVSVDERGGGRTVLATLRDADRLGLADTGARLRALAERARARALRTDEEGEATFALASLGGQGVEQWGPSVPAGTAAILAIGAARELPVVRAGQVVVGHEMKLTLSCDPRALAGASAATFLSSLRQLLEAPLLLVDPA